MNKFIFGMFVTTVMFASCNDKSKAQGNEKKVSKTAVKPKVSEYKSSREEYRGRNYFGNRGESKALYIKKIVYPKKTLYVYKYQFYTGADSLLFYKNSVKLNGTKMKLLNKKWFSYKGKTIKVEKYCYFPTYPSEDRYIGNFFVNDSLGFIMSRISGEGEVDFKYRPEKYNELINKIFPDTSFCKWQY